MKYKGKIIQFLCLVGLLSILVTGVQATPINYGDYVNGTISTLATWDTYTFSGTAGDPVYLRLKTSFTAYGQIKLYAPNGTLLASPSDFYGAELAMTLPATGTYTMLVGDSDGNNIGTYDLYLQRTKNPAKPIVISYSDYINGTLAHPALWNTYTFTGTAGDRVYLRLKTSITAYGQIKLYAPNGTLLASPSDFYGAELTTILPAVSGAYTVLVGDSDGNNIGTYDLYLQRTKNPSKPIPISYSDYINGTLAHPALWNTYTFTGTAGDPVYIRLKTSITAYGQIKLYVPNGTLLASPSDFYGAVLTATLPANGTYTVLVGDSDGNNIGTYDLYLQRTKNPANPIPISYGDDKNGALAHPALWNTYTFSGIAGDRVYTRLTTSITAYGQIRFYAPNGTLLSSPSDFYGTELTITLPVTGKYSILAGDSDGNDVGTYDLYLQYLGSEAVIADFSANKTSGKSPLAVQFSDLSSNSPYAWNWSFGDGKYSNAKNPVHTYSGSGLYTVTLTATNIYNSNSLVKKDFINVTSSSSSSSIIVTAPNGGETWQVGTTPKITWTSTGTVGSYVRIELLKGGAFVQNISASTPNDGSFASWAIPTGMLAGTDYKVRITSTTNPTITDMSNANFAINSVTSSSIMVTSPNGGETWTRGTTPKITWTSTGTVGSYVRIELLKAGAFVQNISASTPNDGSFASWAIPTGIAPGTDYKVRITSTTNLAITDSSNSTFTISGTIPTITVNFPNGGETWVLTTTPVITWTSTGNAGSNVKIELLKAGILVQTLRSSTPNDGLFTSWAIPTNLVPGTDYRIRITSTTSSAYNDTSNSDFIVIAPYGTD